MVSITGTNCCVDIVSDKRHGRFGGELGSKAFYADIDDFQWINTGGRVDETSKICLILEALEANHVNPFRVSFPFSKVSELVRAMQSVPDLLGKIVGNGEESFRWELPSGIVLTGTPNAASHDWNVVVSYQHDGKELQLTHFHSDDDKILDDLIDFQVGRKFSVTKTNLFGKTTMPKMIDKATYDKLSDSKKTKYTKL